MDDYVFISYSNKDKHIADLICVELEKINIKCWYAPRDIVPGENWAGSIIKAISSAKIMVLVFSTNSNISKQVLREVERAINKNVIIIPFRIENIVLSDEMEYYISSCHWLDAYTEPVEKHIYSLCDNLRKIIPNSSISYSIGSKYRWWNVIGNNYHSDSGNGVQIECQNCGGVKEFDPIFGEKPSDDCLICGFDGVKKPKKLWYVIQNAGMGDRDIICRKCRHIIMVTHYESDFVIPEKCPACGHS